MIQKANINDLNDVVNIMEEIKQEMREENNPQWGSTEDNYPSTDKLKRDIFKNSMFKYVEDGIIKGIFTVMEDDGEYDEVIENSKKKSYIIHRLAVPKQYRKLGIATKLMEFAEEIAKNNHIEVLKSDTEVCNVKTNKLFIKLGYEFKGVFTYDDYPGTYNYYEKEI